MGLNFFFHSLAWGGAAGVTTQGGARIFFYFYFKKRGNSIDLFEILFLKNNWRPMKLI